MVPLLTRCKLCLLKFIQLTENKRKTEYKQSARIMMHRMSNPIVKRLNLTFVFASFISMESASKFGVVPYHLNLHIFLKAKIGGHLKQLFFYLLYLSINALGFNYFVAVVLFDTMVQSIYTCSTLSWYNHNCLKGHQYRIRVLKGKQHSRTIAFIVVLSMKLYKVTRIFDIVIISQIYKFPLCDHAAYLVCLWIGLTCFDYLK